MKIIQKLLLLACSALMCWSSVLHAEDIDIYVDNGTTVGVPNVLFVLIDTLRASAPPPHHTGARACRAGS